MNKSELIEAVAKQTGLSISQTAEVVALTLDTMTQALQSGEKIQLTGFGTFTAKHCAARMGRNPRTGAPAMIPERNTVSFKPSAALQKEMEDAVCVLTNI